MTAGEFYRRAVRRQLGGPPCLPFPAITTPAGVLYLALLPSLLRKNPGPIDIPPDLMLDPIRSQDFDTETTAGAEAWLRAHGYELED